MKRPHMNISIPLKCGVFTSLSSSEPLPHIDDNQQQVVMTTRYLKRKQLPVFIDKYFVEQTDDETKVIQFRKLPLKKQRRIHLINNDKDYYESSMPSSIVHIKTRKWISSSASSTSFIYTTATSGILKTSNNSNNKVHHRNVHVRFALSATTVHSLGRPNFSHKGRIKYEKKMDSLSFGEPEREEIKYIPDEKLLNEESEELEENIMKHLLWYSKSELKLMKNEARRSCRMIHLSYPELHSNESKSTNEEACNALDDTASLLLSKSSKFQHQRGLERWSSKDYNNARSISLMHCKTEFFLQQSNQFLVLSSSSRCLSSVDDNNNNYNNNLSIMHCDSSKLAEMYRKMSQPAVRIAKILGQADSYIAQAIFSVTYSNIVS